MVSEYKRFPAARRRLDSVDPENDVRVRVLGTVIEKTNERFVLDDGISSAPVENSVGSEVAVGQHLIAFCKVIHPGDGFRLVAELVQDVRGLDIALYNKVFFQ